MSEEHSSAIRSTMEDIIAIYEWCSVDPVDRGYSALDNEILRAKRLLATTALPSADRPSPDSKLEAYRKALEAFLAAAILHDDGSVESWNIGGLFAARKAACKAIAEDSRP